MFGSLGDTPFGGGFFGVSQYDMTMKNGQFGHYERDWDAPATKEEGNDLWTVNVVMKSVPDRGTNSGGTQGSVPWNQIGLAQAIVGGSLGVSKQEWRTLQLSTQKRQLNLRYLLVTH